VCSRSTTTNPRRLFLPSPLIEERSDRSAFYNDSVKRAPSVRLCNTLSCVCVCVCR
jgi:hypothetical protein